MPWKETTPMSAKIEVVELALRTGSNISELCKRTGISRKTLYKWLARYKEQGKEGLHEKTRRPSCSPKKTAKEIEDKIIVVRKWKLTWGARKIRKYLQQRGERLVPAKSTITDILHRHGYIDEEDSERRKKQTFIRFEHAAPNDLWQMDFKGHFAMQKGRCHPLTILDDHSRYAVELKACGKETAITVKNCLIDVFKKYGLPWRINVDNGSPWGSPNSRIRYTALSIWLIRMGIKVSFSRIYHPQTNGKDERFHRTLKTELLQFHCFNGLIEAQKYFEKWRDEYNLERPHEALGMETPITRYRISERKYSEHLPKIEYRSNDIVCPVSSAGTIAYRSKRYFICEALSGQLIALRPYDDGKYNVVYCDQKIMRLDLRTGKAK